MFDRARRPHAVIPAPDNPAMIRAGLANAGLRIATLAGRFLLILILGRYLEPADIGDFGVIQAALVFLVLAVGLDFYIYTTREILRPDGPRPVEAIWGQLRFQAKLWSIWAIVFVVLGLMADIGLTWILVGSGLLLAEHLGQESSRILFALSRPIRAATVLWLKGGAWPIALAALFVYNPEARSLDTVLITWLAGSVVATVAGWAMLYDELAVADGWSPPGPAWTGRGVRVALRYVAATLLFVSLDYADRFLVYHFLGDAAAGVFTVYFSLANVVKLLVFSAVVSVLYPKLISAWQSGDASGYAAVQNRMIKAVPLVAALTAFLMFPALWVLLMAIDRPEYWQDLPAFIWMLVAAFTGALAYVPHFTLIAKGRDNAFLLSVGLSALCLGLLDLLLIPTMGLVGAGIAKFLAAAVLLAAQTTFSRRGSRPGRAT
jgi:O-antigen/teichoic acid export membrane protein